MNDDEKKYVANFSLALKEFRGKFGRKGKVGGSAKDPGSSTASGKTGKAPKQVNTMLKPGDPGYDAVSDPNSKWYKWNEKTQAKPAVQLTPKQNVLAIAEEWGFPKERVVFSSRQTDEYGNHANYDPATKKITLFASLFTMDATEKRISGGYGAVFKHELAHAQIGENYGILDKAFDVAFGKGNMSVYGNIYKVSPVTGYAESIGRRAKQTKHDMRIYGNETYAELVRIQGDERYSNNDPRWKVFFEACRSGIKKLKTPEFANNESATEKFIGFKGSVSSNFEVSMDSEWTPCEPRDAAFAIEITSDGKKSFIMRPPENGAPAVPGNKNPAVKQPTK